MGPLIKFDVVPTGLIGNLWAGSEAKWRELQNKNGSIEAGNVEVELVDELWFNVEVAAVDILDVVFKLEIVVRDWRATTLIEGTDVVVNVDALVDSVTNLNNWLVGGGIKLDVFDKIWLFEGKPLMFIEIIGISTQWTMAARSENPVVKFGVDPTWALIVLVVL